MKVARYRHSAYQHGTC